MKYKKYIQHFVAFVIGILLLLPALLRDIKLEASYPSDLRNRQVGARLIKDGRLPYFYHYALADGTRYLDIKNCGPLSASNITATPYLHQLLIPICELPFRKFSFLWLVITYALLAIMYVLVQTISTTVFSKVVAWLSVVIFPYTEAWKIHVYQGQYYLIIPFLLLVFYWLFIKKQTWLNILLIGIVGVSIVLVRPTAMVFFLPFLFLLKQYKQQIFSILTMGICAVVFLLANPFQKSLWQQYSAGIKEHIKIHQNAHPTLQTNPACPEVTNVEGFNLTEINAHLTPQTFYSEAGNFHTLWQMVVKQPLPLNQLYIIEFAVMLLLVITYYISHKKAHTFSILNAILLGFALLMLADLFAPINRGQYNTVQWIFALLLITQINFTNKTRWCLLLIWLGLILNIANVSFIKMEHTIGEYCMLLGCSLLAMKKLPQTFFATSTT